MILKYRGGGGFNSLTSNYRSGTMFPFLLLYFESSKLVLKGPFCNKEFNINDIVYSCIVLTPFKTLYLIVLDEDRNLLKFVFLPLKSKSFMNTCEERLTGLIKVKFSFNFYARLDKIAKKWEKEGKAKDNKNINPKGGR